MRWFTSDLHINHKNIIEYCRRPCESVVDMNSLIVDRWNSLVKQDDEVFVVGDVFLGKPEEAEPWIRSLNGRKILISGNHDRSPRTMKSLGFDEVHNSMIVRVGEMSALLRHKPLPDSMISPCDVQIHGHHHTGNRINGRRLNVAVDLWDFMPVSESQINKSMFNCLEEDSVTVSFESGYAKISAHVKVQHVEGLSEVLNEMVRNFWSKEREKVTK